MFLPAPRNRSRDFPSWPMVIAAVVQTLPLLLLIVLLSPTLLIGPLLPGRQRYTLRLLATLQHRDHQVPNP